MNVSLNQSRASRCRFQAVISWARSLACLLVGCFAAASWADDLLYVYGPECGACMKFDAEIGPIYDKTAEAQTLPMVKVTLDDWQAGNHPLTDCAIKPVHGTPTFIQVADCNEVDRITGYSNDELFWFALSRFVNRSLDESS